MTDSMDQQYYKPLIAIVSEAEHGKTVRTVLERQLGVSRKLLSQVKLTEHGLTVNEKRTYTTAPVSQGDVIRLRMEREISEDILPQPIPIEIVYEDEELLIVNKPAGMIVHPTHGHYTGTLANGVVYHWQQKGERVRFRPVHRLDEDTSGIVAIAKTSYVHQQLSEQMQANGFLKQYRAYVYGCPEPASGTVDAPIDRDPDEPHIRIVTPDGYPSVTHYTALMSFIRADEQRPLAAAVLLKLETGRTHQIRVHMQHIGCPLIGDKMYGPKQGAVIEWEETAGRQALHAEILGFTHPITREWMEWKAPLPPELALLEQKLLQA
ncbi:RluA family pseudouridine synthase [Paenibacillus sp. sgz302251]|uniref:RluA family pseudouridine synthase n=1 Tax=Paenibacillus sp. sgz302251 TaxID=3414493 RepID=UPI003C7AF5D4